MIERVYYYGKTRNDLNSSEPRPVQQSVSHITESCARMVLSGTWRSIACHRARAIT